MFSGGYDNIDHAPSNEQYTQQAKLNAQVIIDQLTDIAGLYHCGILGQLEAAGLTTAGDTMLSAIAKLELLKQSL